MAPTYSTFIGPEGADLGKVFVGSNGDSGASVDMDPRNMNDEDILRQLSVARSIEATRPMTQSEKDHYATLQSAYQDRQLRKTNSLNDEVLKAFNGGSPAAGGAGPGGPSGPPIFDQAGYDKSTNEAADRSRAALDTMFRARQGSGVQALNEVFDNQRKRAIEEEAALGRLRSPASAAPDSVISQSDATRGKQIGDFITNMQGQYGQAAAGVEQNIANLQNEGRKFSANLAADSALRGQDLGLRERLGKAGLIQSGQQFGQGAGLQERQFAEQQRRTSLDDLFNRDSMAQAERLGKMRADAEDPGVLGQIGQIAGGVGQLAGGIGALSTGNPMGIAGVTGGVNSLTKKPKAAPVLG